MKFHFPLLALVALVTACQQARLPEQYAEEAAFPQLYPDYVGVTVPVNMAPLHFQLVQEPDEMVTRLHAGSEEVILEGRQVCPDFDQWQALVEQAKDDSIAVDVFVRKGEKWSHYQPFGIHVSSDSIDAWLTYRLISPSYVTYEELTLNQRCLESYEERVIYDNMLCSTEQNGQCINCHHSQLGNPQRTQFHARQNATAENKSRVGQQGRYARFHQDCGICCVVDAGGEHIMRSLFGELECLAFGVVLRRQA
jgi:hypothetical protein